MEDTQRSQSISTENQTIAKQAAFDPEQGALESGKDGPPLLGGAIISCPGCDAGEGEAADGVHVACPSYRSNAA
jgi:hypothetical protein